MDYTLLDDGTLDTVVECHCLDCGNTWEERFGDTSDYRDDSGAMDDLTGLMEDYDIYCEKCEG